MGFEKVIPVESEESNRNIGSEAVEGSEVLCCSALSHEKKSQEQRTRQ